MPTCHTLSTHVLLSTGVGGLSEVDAPVPVVREGGPVFVSHRSGVLCALNFRNKPNAPARAARHNWRWMAPAGDGPGSPSGGIAREVVSLVSAEAASSIRSGIAECASAADGAVR